MEGKNCDHNYDINKTHCTVCGSINFSLVSEIIIFNSCASALNQLMDMMRDGLDEYSRADFKLNANFVKMSLDIMSNKQLKNVTDEMFKDVINSESNELEYNTKALLAITETKRLMREKNAALEMPNQDAQDMAMLALKVTAKDLPEDYQYVCNLIEWDINGYRPVPDKEEILSRHGGASPFFNDDHNCEAIKLHIEFKKRLKNIVINWEEKKGDLKEPPFQFANDLGSLVHFFVSNTIATLNKHTQLKTAFIHQEYEDIVAKSKISNLLSHELFTDSFLDHIKDNVTKSLLERNEKNPEGGDPVSFKDSPAFERIISELGALFK